ECPLIVMITRGRLPPPSLSTNCAGTSNPLMGSAGSARARNLMICSSRLVGSSPRVPFGSLSHDIPLSALLGRASLVPELGQAPLEQAPFCVVVDQRQRALIGGASLAVAAEAVQQPGASGMQIVEVLQRERLENPKPRVRPLRLGDRDRPVELHHRRACHAR